MKARMSTYTFTMDIGARAAGVSGGGTAPTTYIWRLFFYDATTGSGAPVHFSVSV